MRIIDFAKKEKTITALFLFSIVFFIWQLQRGIGWDMAVYILNAKYFFANGFYFELLRPPLIPAIMGILGLMLGFSLAPYAYIMLSATLHLVSSLELAKTLGIDRKIFYAFSVTPFFLMYGVQQGSEVLSLALLQFFISAIISGKSSGAFLGLSMLARYTNSFFAALLVFRGSVKNIAKDAAIAVLVFLPWLAYNAASVGSPFASLEEYFSLNVSSRALIARHISAEHIIYALGFLAPLFFAGAMLALGKVKSRDKKDTLMIAVALLAFLAYYVAPLKNQRFLFPIILPAAYFSERAIISMQKNAKKYLVAAIIALNISVAVYLLVSGGSEIKSASSVAFSADKNCSYMSNYWVYMNYYGLKTIQPPPIPEEVPIFLSQGQRIIFFRGVGDPEYAENWDLLRNFSVLEEKRDSILLGNQSACIAPQEKIYLHAP